MCTLTVVALPGRGVRVGFNRDEQKTRPAALPPSMQVFGSRNAVLPTDPVSGGTWLAVNDAGLTLAVLNVNPITERDRPATRSRGIIIPALLDHETPADALAELERAFDFRDFAPFRLVLVGNAIVATVRWDGHQPMVTSRLLGGAPLLFTSSGLGDHLVEDVRRELFDTLFASRSDNWERVQDEFHRHQWPGREHLSVNMTRTSARTVSFTVVDLTPDDATLTYHPVAPPEFGEPTILHLPFRPVGVA